MQHNMWFACVLSQYKGLYGTGEGWEMVLKQYTEEGWR